MARNAVASLPSVVIAIVILAAAWGLARLAAGIVQRLVGHTRLRGDLKELLETLVKVTIWVVAFLLASKIVIPGFTFGGMVAGLGIGAVAIGFAFQDIFKNFLAGVLIMLREKMRIGDLIECEDIRGKVEHISLRETHIRQLSGELTIVPNSLLFEKPIQIMTDMPLRRDELIIAVDLGADLDAARKAIEQAIAAVETVDPTRTIDVFAHGVDGGLGALELQLRWWTNAQINNIAAVRSDVTFAVIRALSEAGVKLPKPTTELVTRDEDVLERV